MRKIKIILKEVKIIIYSPSCFCGCSNPFQLKTEKNIKVLEVLPIASIEQGKPRNPTGMQIFF